MKKKIWFIGIVSMLLISNFTVVSAVSTNIENEELATNMLTNNQQSQFYTFIEYHFDIDSNPLLKQILQDSLPLTDSADPPDLPDIPLFHEFPSCDDIYISGIGLWNMSKTPSGEDVILWMLEEGEVVIKVNDEKFRFVYKSREIMGAGIFYSFNGFLEPEESQDLFDEFGDIVIDGSAGFGGIFELSFLVMAGPKKIKYKIGNPISLFTMQFEETSTGDDLKLDNPHFYFVDISDIETGFKNGYTIYDEQVEDSWILKPDEQIKWDWTQKLPRGDYFGAAGFIIKERVHPTIMEAIQVRYIAGNNKAINIPFLSLLEKHLDIFPILQRLIKL